MCRSTTARKSVMNKKRRQTRRLPRNGVAGTDDTPADSTTNLWPQGAKPAQKPPRSCYSDAKTFCTVSYQRVDRMLAQFKGCLADGYPFVFGFTVYESFESAEVGRTGVLKMPKPKEGVVGGDAVLAVGYDDQSQRFIVRNSWVEAGDRKATSLCLNLSAHEQSFRRFLDHSSRSLSLPSTRLKRCPSLDDQ